MYDKNLHRRRSVRLSGYDYSYPGLYFVTICTQDKKCIFGRIENGEMMLNSFGHKAADCWNDIPNHFLNVVLHEYIIMPNHLHGIIEITGEFIGVVGAGDSLSKNVGANDYLPLQSVKLKHGTSKTIGSMIRGFKIGVAKQVGKPVWQRNYYEHIIRDGADYEKITNYIMANPQTWDSDKLYRKQLDEFNKQFE